MDPSKFFDFFFIIKSTTKLRQKSILKGPAI